MNERVEPAPTDEAISAPEASPAGPMAGFWYRILALTLDIAVLATIGATLGAVFGSFFAQLGAWGPLVGFGIPLAYYGGTDSSLGGGQTLGKRVAGIRVVGQDGGPLSLSRSICRTAILFLAYYVGKSLVQSAIVPEVVLDVLPFATGVTLFLIGGGVLYSLLYPSRQALHDLICRPYVIRTSASRPIESPPRREDYIVFIAWVALATLFGAVIESRTPRADLVVPRARLRSEIGVVSPNVSRGLSRDGQRSINVQVTWLGKLDSHDRTIDGIARIVLETNPAIEAGTLLQVSVSSGYDIGIWGWKQTHGAALPHEQWKTRLGSG